MCLEMVLEGVQRSRRADSKWQIVPYTSCSDTKCSELTVQITDHKITIVLIFCGKLEGSVYDHCMYVCHFRVSSSSDFSQTRVLQVTFLRLKTLIHC